ncbi:serine/threonine protein kinase [Prauserella shujinwangii]|uniref:non-specific serine/threonine protein kinase n=1 Tax=Prauserella shujinwangii TaxID=1453103 RepID=A0A2T0LMP7_9PSEU|nr:serine/threonine-protein kinase [Prauserella shujinwangii]PRX44353.1 serine/threonine protein kinase [Prauserella shujinwangii]
MNSAGRDRFRDRVRHNRAVSTPGAESRLVAGRYRLLSVLGSGSMGTVWSAYDEFLQRPVAVKEVRLPQGVAAAQAGELRERTMREARAIAVLSHPNVIVLHDVARENGDPFVVMELLPARSLAALLREHGPLTVAQAAAVAEAVASALEAAHASGITHRDVKPGNVLVARDGRIKLTDFGIARNVSEATMTRTGMMLGSPAYIAPEVASGGPVTYAADLWGLGATLFAATAGRPPYDVDGNAIETVNLVVRGEVPQPPPGPLAPVIRGLMAKDPAARMSLAEARSRVYSLLAAPRQPLFGPELFAGEATAGPEASVTRVIPQVTPEPEPDGAELAADPGPLPFDTAGEPAAPRRGRTLRGPALVVTAVLLFVAATATGFALTRLVGGQALTPPPRSSPTAPPRPTETRELVTRQGDATNLRGAQGGLFSVRVPEDWTRFITQQPAERLPSSTLVQFVSANGTQALNVQRYADFFPGYSLTSYVRALESYWPPGDFHLVESEPLGGEEGRRLTYRTAERASTAAEPAGDPPERAMNRTTIARAFRSGTSLWVVSVTVPVEQEQLGRTELFDRIVPTFRMTN